MIMEILLNILGYGFISVVIIGALYIFVKLLTTGLDALTKNDD
jgi:Flp pilus assembly pilin Flp